MALIETDVCRLHIIVVLHGFLRGFKAGMPQIAASGIHLPFGAVDDVGSLHRTGNAFALILFHAPRSEIPKDWNSWLVEMIAKNTTLHCNREINSQRQLPDIPKTNYKNI